MNYTDLDPEPYEKAADLIERDGLCTGRLWPGDNLDGDLTGYRPGVRVCTYGGLMVALDEHTDMYHTPRTRLAVWALGEYLAPELDPHDRDSDLSTLVTTWSDSESKATVVATLREFAGKIRAEQGTAGDGS